MSKKRDLSDLEFVHAPNLSLVGVVSTSSLSLKQLVFIGSQKISTENGSLLFRNSLTFFFSVYKSLKFIQDDFLMIYTQKHGSRS